MESSSSYFLLPWALVGCLWYPFGAKGDQRGHGGKGRNWGHEFPSFFSPTFLFCSVTRLHYSKTLLALKDTHWGAVFWRATEFFPAHRPPSERARASDGGGARRLVKEVYSVSLFSLKTSFPCKARFLVR